MESNLTPKQIVSELDKFIIGQSGAKRAVAVAIRNRIRRRNLEENLREEIYPKNIIMIGPTGVGKTEIARRLAKLYGAPFLKVEATKYTEVGYVGRDVESMIRDLSQIAMNLVKTEFRKSVEEKARERAKEAVLDVLIAPPPTKDQDETYKISRELMQKKLESGKLDDSEIEIDAPQNSNASGMPMLQVFGAGNMEEIDNQLQNLLGDLSPKKSKKKKMKIVDALKTLAEVEADKLLDMDKLMDEARRRTEEMGIVFLDEIDKIAGSERKQGADVSREGVQRDLLPIVEGSTVNTKIGPIKTDHILFIAAGAFHMSKPSDLIPELQGRFPIRVELEKLSEKDFESILTKPELSLIKQYQALLGTEGVVLQFESDAISEVAKIAYEMNERNENIGARRLNTILEKVLEEISFDAPDYSNDQKNIKIDKNFIQSRLKGIIENRDLSKYIL